MKINKLNLNKIRWIARISGTIIFLFILTFYIGYEFPLPNISLTIFENIWLTIIPLFQVGLVIGWKWEKTAGYLIVIPIILGFLISLILWEDPSFVMSFPLIPGALYILYGYKKDIDITYRRPTLNSSAKICKL